MATPVATPQTHGPVSGHIAALDGWRGVAILLVLIDHLQSALFGRHFLLVDTGQHGVTIFFVLSGFLITSKLLEPQCDFRSFYMRRFFRLMPAAWCYLAFLAIVVPFIGTRILSSREALSCVFFYRNYLSILHGIGTFHYWSLSLEEQFYLVWPCLLFALATPCRGAWFAGTAAVVCATYRFLRWSHYDHIWMSFRTEVRIDALLIGCLLAVAIQHPSFRAFILRWAKLCTAPLLVLVAICVSQYHWLPPLFENVSIALLIAASLESPSVLARSLSVKWLAYLGTISYSVYIWQQYFMGLEGPRGFIVALIALPLFILISYYYVEKPCIRLGRRIEYQLLSSRKNEGILRPSAGISSC